MENGDQKSLPDNWTEVELQAVVKWSNGKGLTKKNMVDGPFAVFGGNGKTGQHNSYISETDSIVVGRVGANCGNVHLAPAKTWITDNAIYSSWKAEFVDSKYLTLLLKTLELNNLSGGSGQPYVSQGILNNIKIPLAPFNEQRRIIAKIEELFSDLDAGVAQLKQVQQQLKRYRQSVLKAAVEGKLTAAWRAQHGHEVEPAEQLLARILEERRAKWEAEQLAKYEAKGKKPPKGWQDKYKEPEPPDTSELPDLPAGWVWSNISIASEILDHLRKPINKKERARREGDIPYYGANGQVGWIDDYLFDEPLVLVVEDETFTGREKPFSYKIEGKSWVNNHAHVLRASPGINVDYLNGALMFYPFIPLTTGTTGRKKLTKSALSIAPLAIPPSKEQDVIVELVDERLSVVEKVAEEIELQLIRAKKLRQSILSQAFKGLLVKQNPVDEPAKNIVENISNFPSSSSTPKKYNNTNQIALDL